MKPWITSSTNVSCLHLRITVFLFILVCALIPLFSQLEKLLSKVNMQHCHFFGMYSLDDSTLSQNLRSF